MCRPTNTTSNRNPTSPLVNVSSGLGGASSQAFSDASATMTPIRVDTKALGLQKGSTTTAATATTPETLATTGSNTEVSTPTKDIFRPEPNWFILQTPGSPQPYRNIIHENEMATDLMMFGAHHTAPADFAGARCCSGSNKNVIVDVDIFDEDDLVNHSELIMPLMDEDRVEDAEEDGAAALKIPALSSQSLPSRERLQPRQPAAAASHHRQRSHSDLGRMISIAPPAKFRLRPRPLSPRTALSQSTSSSMFDNSDNAVRGIDRTLTWPSSPHRDATTAGSGSGGSSSCIEALSQMAGMSI